MMSETRYIISVRGEGSYSREGDGWCFIADINTSNKLFIYTDNIEEAKQFDDFETAQYWLLTATFEQGKGGGMYNGSARVEEIELVFLDPEIRIVKSTLYHADGV